MKEAKGLLVGGRCEPDKKSIKVFKHPAPLVVDAAVAFIGHDDIECLDGNGRIIAHLLRRLALHVCIKFKKGLLFLCRVKLRLTREDGIEALNGGNTDLGYLVNAIALKNMKGSLVL